MTGAVGLHQRPTLGRTQPLHLDKQRRLRYSEEEYERRLRLRTRSARPLNARAFRQHAVDPAQARPPLIARESALFPKRAGLRELSIFRRWRGSYF